MWLFCLRNCPGRERGEEGSAREKQYSSKFNKIRQSMKRCWEDEWTEFKINEKKVIITELKINEEMQGEKERGTMLQERTFSAGCASLP